MKAQELRSLFIKFFEQKAHQKIDSSSLVPENDPTLLFANAGMNQFKDIFTGQRKPTQKRAVTIQKCVRAGGKHNDLENVGFTARHHTFFEMMGNFSFGDYFKEDAIKYAWEFLTKVLNLPSEKLYITIHLSDDEAETIWHEQIGIPKNKIFRKDKDNFWEMGEYGPCGPCSEIFYDYGPKYSTPNFKSDCLIDDESRYVEIWNLVFMQFEKTPEGTRPLPNPCIDTGMGLERLMSVLTDSYWNYNTECFMPIIRSLEKYSTYKYETHEYSSAFRVVADHTRSATMLITDGVIPSNEGRGYVLRRIIRRGIRFLRELGIKGPSMHKLVCDVFAVLGEAYPANQANQSLAIKLIKIEEEKFIKTLENGLKYLEQALDEQISNNTLPGSVAFKLYDTYGFPIDLTELILREKNLLLDHKGLDEAMKKQRDQSQKSWKGGNLTGDEFTKYLNDQLSSLPPTIFKGYEGLNQQGQLLKIINIENETKNKSHYLLVFDQTPFYAEGGGQVGDRGLVEIGSSSYEVVDTKLSPTRHTLHYIKENPELLKIGQSYNLQVNESKRCNTAHNHSATHLLQSALIKTLGDHIKQAGSLVNEEKLRFDFTHHQSLSRDEIIQIENIVNTYIQNSLPVTSQIMAKEDAIKKGAMALFGEKYDDQVRVIQMGNVSTELCGGTHVFNTGQIGPFIITSETSISSGVRRIEAITGQKALQYLLGRSRILSNIEQFTGYNSASVLKGIESYQEKIQKLEKTIQQHKNQQQQNMGKELFSQVEQLKNGQGFKEAKVDPNTDLKKLSDYFVDQQTNATVFLYSINEQRITTLLRTHKMNKAIDCSKILKEALKIIEGRGGGRKDMAQGQGQLIDNAVPKLIKVIKNSLESSS